MVRPNRRCLIFRLRQPPLRHQILQRRLPVRVQSLRRGVINLVLEQAQNHLAGRIKPMLQVHRAENRLGGVRQNGVLILTIRGALPLTQQNMLTKANLSGNIREAITADHASAHLGNIALWAIWVLAIQLVRHRQAQNRIAQKLEAFIVRQHAILVGERTMRQRQHEQILADAHA